MRITFDANKQEFHTTRFETEAAWRTYLEPLISSRKDGYAPEPMDRTPPGFPCIMLSSSSIIYHPGKNDEFPNFFILASSIEEEIDEGAEAR